MYLTKPDMTTLKIALDWTPNTNHTGFFTAQELGFYAEAGLKVEIRSPDEDNYATTPAKKLETGLVDFAIAPFESVISLNTKTNKVNAVAIAALLQNDISSIATLSSSNISRPKELDHKTYASYRARYEDQIVKQMIINDGGTGNINISYPEKLGIWETLTNNTADATWIFNNWEGVEAETNNLKLNTFSLADYNIPYAYSPVIFSTKENISDNKETYKALLKATKKGFDFAFNHNQQAAAILTKFLPARDVKAIDVSKSQLLTSPHYGTGNNWGKMDKNRITNFLNWLIANDLVTEEVLNIEFFTNELLS